MSDEIRVKEAYPTAVLGRYDREHFQITAKTVDDFIVLGIGLDERGAWTDAKKHVAHLVDVRQ